MLATHPLRGATTATHPLNKLQTRMDPLELLLVFGKLAALAVVAAVSYVLWPLKVPRLATPFRPPSVESVATPGSASPGKGEIRRNALSHDRLVSTFLPGVETTYDLFCYAVDRFGLRDFLGHRKKEKDGTFGEYEWKTYSHVKSDAFSLGSGLLSLGAQPGDRIGIFSINRPEWTIAGIACSSYSLISVPIYDTLGDQAVRFVIRDADIKVIICNSTTILKILEIVKDCPSIKTIISMDPLDGRTQSKYSIPETVSLWQWEDVKNMGLIKSHAPIPPTSQSVYTISYTSGTTGNPKGVVLTHFNIISFVSATLYNEEQGGKYDSKMRWFDRENQDVYLSYLPLAHVMERALQEILMAIGAGIGFYSGDTNNLMRDVAVLKPTIFASVPRIFNRIHGQATSKLNSLKYPKRVIKDVFDYGFNQKHVLLKKGSIKMEAYKTFNSVLGHGKVRSVLGGRVRIMVTGSAPIAGHVLDWFRVVFGCHVVEGYGLTETCASVCGTRIDHLKPGSVGIPGAAVEVRLIDVPEMGYHVTDKPQPRGEILVRGNTVFKEYYNNKELTEEAFFEGDWFRTGDIGTWNVDGTLSIIDRKKNIFKLSQGEYIAPEKIEQICQRSSFVQLIFVHGDSTRNHLVAIVVPNPEYVAEWAKQKSITDSDIGTLCQNSVVKAAVLSDLKETSRAAGLKGFEVIQAIHLEPKPFSVEENLITPSFKNLRHNCRKKYESIIAGLYREIESSAK